MTTSPTNSVEKKNNSSLPTFNDTPKSDKKPSPQKNSPSKENGIPSIIEPSDDTKSLNRKRSVSSLFKGKSKSTTSLNTTPANKKRALDIQRAPSSEPVSNHKRKRRSIFSFINNPNRPQSVGSADEAADRDDFDSDDDIAEDNKESRELGHKSKRTKTHQLTPEEIQEQEAKAAFEKREHELDQELPPEYRKFRPRGFKFNIPPKDRPIRIYADGVFDLFHLGHMRQLEQAKKALPNATLVCGIPSDEETHRRKGLTVLTDKQRCDTLLHCKWVDEVIPNAPWCVTPEFLEEHKIDYVAHDDLPYASGDSDDIYKPIKELGKFLTTQRTEGISTSDIITKIIRDYDKYLMRNLARGASRQELNVSWFKKNELDLKRHVQEFRESFKTKDLYSEIRAYIANTLGNGGDRGDDSDSSRKDTREVSPVSEFVNGYTGSSVVGTVKGWLSRKSSAPNSPPRE